MPRRRTWESWADETRTRLWPLPVLALISAVALGIGLPRLDAAIGDNLPAELTVYLFGGGAGAARTVLNVIATSLITVTSLTFSLTVLTLQLASSQYSPRLLRTFTRDRFVQRTLALFIGSFVYALTVLRTVRTPDDGGTAFVPQLSVTVAFLLTLGSALGIVLFLAHLAREIRVETVLRNVHDDAAATIDRAVPPRGPRAAPRPCPPPTGQTGVLLAPSSGFIVAIHPAVLLDAARAADAVVVVDRPVGDALVAGTPLARAWSNSPSPLTESRLDVLQERLGQAVDTSFERTSRQDVAFGLRQLTDVTVKALSPAVNDPTTAVHALNHLSALLCDLTRRDLNALVLRDDAGRVRITVEQRSFAELLDLALAQPRIYGAGDPDVARALLQLLHAVATAAAHDPTHAAAVAEQLTRVQVAVDQGPLDEAHRQKLTQLVLTVDAALTSRDAPASLEQTMSDPIDCTS